MCEKIRNLNTKRNRLILKPTAEFGCFAAQRSMNEMCIKYKRYS